MDDNDLLDLLPSGKTAEELEADRKALEAQNRDDDEDSPAAKAAAEFDRLRKQADRMARFQDIADELDADPRRIYDVRAALEGRPLTSPAPATQQNLTADQLEALDEQARSKPAQFAAAAADLAARQQLDTFYKNAMAPIIEASGEGLVDSFKAKKGKDPLYEQIAEQFDKEMSDVDRAALLRAPKKVRDREMALRWDAADAKVLRGAMAESKRKEHDTARNLGSSSGRGTSSKRTTRLAENPDLLRLARATGAISREDFEEILGEAADFQGD